MSMRFLQEGEIPLEPVFAFPFFDFALHAGEVGGEFEGVAVVEPDPVVGLAFEEVDAFGFERGVEFGEGFAEEVGEEEEGGALVEALMG